MLTGGRITLAFWAMTVLALAVGAGGALQTIYPVTAVALVVWLERRGTTAYVSAVLWFWLLSPFVRRVADYQSGWHEPSLILLTPYIVTAWPPLREAAYAALRAIRVAPRTAGLACFAPVVAGAAIGLPLGLLASVSAATVEGLNWLVPIAFGGYLGVRTPQPAAVERAVASTLLQAAVVLGIYAFYQFVLAPPWDLEWLRNTEARSFGQAREFEIRVFSTAHSPGVMACFLVVPVVLWAARPRAWTSAAVAGAALALALSQVRTAWLALALALVLVERRVTVRERLALVGLLAIATVCAVPFIFPIEISDVTSQRFLTLLSPTTDESALSRFEGHTLLLDVLAAHPFGLGAGIEDPRLSLVIGSRDSVLVAALVQFGLVGATVYFAGLGLLFLRLCGYYRTARTPEALALAAGGIGLLAVGLFGTVTAGPLGILVWTIGGLATAHVRNAALAGATIAAAPAADTPATHVIPSAAPPSWTHAWRTR